MARGDDGGGTPPGDRDRLRRALSAGALTPDKPQSVPFDYALWHLGMRMGVPAWVFEGYPIDAPPPEWVIRCLEFSRMEQSVKHG